MSHGGINAVSVTTEPVGTGRMFILLLDLCIFTQLFKVLYMSGLYRTRWILSEITKHYFQNDPMSVVNRLDDDNQVTESGLFIG